MSMTEGTGWSPAENSNLQPSSVLDEIKQEVSEYSRKSKMKLKQQEMKSGPSQSEEPSPDLIAHHNSSIRSLNSYEGAPQIINLQQNDCTLI